MHLPPPPKDLSRARIIGVCCHNWMSKRIFKNLERISYVANYDYFTTINNGLKLRTYGRWNSPLQG